MNRDSDHLFFFRIIFSVISQPCYCICLFLYSFHLTRQILQPAGTPPFHRNLVVSPVRHAKIEQEDIGITQLIRNDSYTYNGIFSYFDALFSKKVTRMSGMLFLLFVQSLFQFGAKEGNERAITGRRIILTCPLLG